MCGRFLAKGRCRDITVIDMRPVAHWTDYMVVATAGSPDHVWRASRGMMYQLKRWDAGVRWGDAFVDGGPGTDWVNIEFPGKAVVNVMEAEARDYYDLESLWVDPDQGNIFEFRADPSAARTYTLDELAA